jgi:DNA-binding CsgD family transcriptional regulator
LGEATDPRVDPDRRAWHLAQAASGPDAAIADELEQSADRARSRGGLAAAAAFLARSAALTPDLCLRGRRAVDAAVAEQQSGAPEAAEALLDTAELEPLSGFDRARAELLRGRIAFYRNRGSGSAELLFVAAQHLEPYDAKMAREAYLEAFLAVTYALPLTTLDVRQMAAAIATAPPAPSPARGTDLILDAWTSLLVEGPAAGTPLVRRATAAFLEDTALSEDVRGVWAAISACEETWDSEGWTLLATRQLQIARESGALPLLGLLLVAEGGRNMQAGNFLTAEAMYQEAMEISHDVGAPPPEYAIMLLHSWRGEREATISLSSKVMQEARATGEGLGQYLAENALVRLYNGYGEYESAVAAVSGWVTRPLVINGCHIFGELIEAAARSGQVELAEHTLALMSAQTQASGTDWGLGEEALARALLSKGIRADALYRESIERLTRSAFMWPCARAQLLYGEWLRREGRRVDARSHLEVASRMLSEMQAHAYAERAARELLATGATSRKRVPDTRDNLTPQERQIALLAACGLTNRQIGEKLFVSHRTIGSHLYRVYPKLGVATRAQLATALQAQRATIAESLTDTQREFTAL